MRLLSKLFTHLDSIVTVRTIVQQLMEGKRLLIKDLLPLAAMAKTITGNPNPIVINYKGIRGEFRL